MLNIENGILAIANEVIGDAKKEADTIVLKAENTAKELLQRAKETADKLHQEILDQTAVKIATEKRKLSSIAEVDIRNNLLQAKESIVDAAFEKTIVKLKVFVTSQEYRHYLFNLIENAVKNFEQKTLILQINAKDREWVTQDMLNQLSDKLQIDLKLSEKSGNYLGGCKIYTVDYRISFDATLDNKLHELKPLLRVKIAKKLFEEF